jgi:hypothetical protein
MKREFWSPRQFCQKSLNLTFPVPLPVAFNAFKHPDESILDVIVSPNKTTVYIFSKAYIHGYDTKTGKKLASFDFQEILPNGFAKKIVMVEWALGKYVPRWKAVLDY